jgi:hypothetical protein
MIPSKVGNSAIVAERNGNQAEHMTDSMCAISPDRYGTPEVSKEVRLPKPVPRLSEIFPTSADGLASPF